MQQCCTYCGQLKLPFFFLHAADFGNEKVMIYWNMKRRKSNGHFALIGPMHLWTENYQIVSIKVSNRKLLKLFGKSYLSSSVSTLLASCQLAEIAVEIVWEKRLQRQSTHQCTIQQNHVLGFHGWDESVPPWVSFFGQYFFYFFFFFSFAFFWVLFLFFSLLPLPPAPPLTYKTKLLQNLPSFCD